MVEGTKPLIAHIFLKLGCSVSVFVYASGQTRRPLFWHTRKRKHYE